jgi:REP element-mobilizing transposase RayT
LRYDNFIAQPRLVRIRTRGRLPHWEVDCAVYFVTFRLNDSLPKEIIATLLEERQRMLRQCVSVVERVRLEAAFTLRLDAQLDRGYGSCLLAQKPEIVANALKYFDRARYELHAWCVMPNHVHVMLYLEHGSDLEKVLHSWKSFTSHQFGKGVIWQREYFDRVVRSPSEFSHTAAYIHANPAKAGLRGWPWIG